MPGQIRLGTSGFHADGWNGAFYPKGMKSDDNLYHYCSRFDTVEVDSTFYRIRTVPNDRMRLRYAASGSNEPFLYAHLRCKADENMMPAMASSAPGSRRREQTSDLRLLMAVVPSGVNICAIEYGLTPALDARNV